MKSGLVAQAATTTVSLHEPNRSEPEKLSRKEQGVSSVVLFGASYKTSSLAYREKLASLISKESATLRRLMGAREFAELVTCNRVEVTLVTDSFSEGKLLSWLSQISRGERETIMPPVYVHRDLAAIRHLFSVASGLDSIVLGEEQIITQVKEAGVKARRSRSSRGGLSALFDASVNVGRRVRAATRPTHESVSSMALRFALSRLPSPPRNVMLIGTGKTSRLAAAQLKGSRLYVATRRSSLPFPGAIKVNHADLKRVARRCDLIVAATKHRGHVLRHGDLPDGKRRRRRVILDLAFPRNIDPALNQGSNEVFNLDDLARIFGPGQREPVGPQAKLTEDLVAEEAESFSRWFLASRQSAALSQVYRWAEATRRSETEAALRRLSKLSDRDKKIVEALGKRLVSKLLAPPTNFAKSTSADFPQNQRLDVIRRVFERGSEET